MKNKLIFLQIPKNYRNRICSGEETFPINLNIPFPVELPGSSEVKDNLQTGEMQEFLSDLDMDMIISGMLRAIEERQVKQEWIDYYSNFILFLRPDILEICQTHEANKNTEAPKN